MKAAEAKKNQDMFFNACDNGTADSYIAERSDQFLEFWDFNSEPSRQAKVIGAWSRENILLEAWNQFLAFNEAESEFVFGMNAANGVLADATRLELVEMFHAYLEGWLSVQPKDNLNNLEQI